MLSRAGLTRPSLQFQASNWQLLLVVPVPRITAAVEWRASPITLPLRCLTAEAQQSLTA